MGSGSSPLSCGVFLPPPLLQAFPLLVAGHVPGEALAFSSQLVVRDFPSPSSALRVPCLVCYMSFLLLLLIIQLFFLFSLGGGRSVQGTMLIWPRVVFGSTAYRLAHLVVRIFPIRLGAAIWQWHASPPGFQDLVLKIDRIEVVTQEVESMSSKCKALNSNYNNTKTDL
jgi:hypothetical protein